MRRILDYAVTEIPPAKLFLGMPNYGYDWTLPFVAGESMAKSLSNEQAVDLARETGSEILYSTQSQAPYFTYQRDGRSHEVWFEDPRSILAKLDLITEYGMKGGSWWNIMRPFTQGWFMTGLLYDVVRPGETI